MSRGFSATDNRVLVCLLLYPCYQGVVLLRARAVCLSMQSWTITDASVACQMMGFVVSPVNWKTFKIIPGSADQPIWRSNVHCTSLDMDLLRCEADDENDHSCTHASDVYVRCIEPTWAGNYRQFTFVTNMY